MIINNLNRISHWIILSLCALTILELIFFPDAENIYGCFTFIVAWILLSRLIMNSECVHRSFVPFLAVSFLGLCFFFLPLPMTLVEGKPLTFRFQCPYSTFNYQLINLIMLILALKLCNVVTLHGNFLTKIWSRIGYFSALSDKQIWMLGIMGIFCRVYMLTIMGTDSARAENLGALGHMLSFMTVYSTFPILLLFKNLYCPKDNTKTNIKPIILYSLVIFILGLATGKRGSIFLYFTTIVSCFMIPYILDEKIINISKKALLGIFFSFYLITGPVVDIAMAMALGRDDSEQTSSSKTLDNIIDIYQDKEKLHTLYQLGLMQTDNGGDNLSGWSEYYLDNILLDRFCNLRVCDMTIDYAQKMGYENRIMQKYMSNQVLFLLPTPILNFLGIYVNKFELQYTPGDLISTEALNLSTQYHGYRVAGDVGIGLLLWGEKYFLYAFFIYFALFFFMSSLTKKNIYNQFIFPLPLLCGIFGYCLYFNNSVGIVRDVSLILRTGIQEIVLYCIVVFILKRIVR